MFSRDLYERVPLHNYLVAKSMARLLKLKTARNY